MKQLPYVNSIGKWFSHFANLFYFVQKDAVKREVLEETGLEMEPTTLVLIESASGSWFRFVLTGNVIGKLLIYKLLINPKNKIVIIPRIID